MRRGGEGELTSEEGGRDRKDEVAAEVRRLWKRRGAVRREEGRGERERGQKSGRLGFHRLSFYKCVNFLENRYSCLYMCCVFLKKNSVFFNKMATII